MIRSLIFLFALANLLLFALSAGWLGRTTASDSDAIASSESHLPLSPERIRIVSRGEPPPKVEPPKQCMEWIDLGLTNLNALEKLVSGNKALQLNHEESQSALTEHRVFIPVSRGGKPAAEKKAAELKKLGVRNFQLERENGGDKWVVVLGAYTTAEEAGAGLAGIRKFGVRSATQGLRVKSPALYRVRLSGPPAALVPVRKLELPGSRDCTGLPDPRTAVAEDTDSAPRPGDASVPLATSAVAEKP